MKAKIITDKHTITIHSPHDEITIQLSEKGYFEHFMDENKEALHKTLDEIHENVRQPKPIHPKPEILNREPLKRKRVPVTTIKKCVHCRKNYSPRSNAQVYCSEQCKLDAKKSAASEPKTENPNPHAPSAMPSSEPKAHYDPKVNPITGRSKD